MNALHRFSLSQTSAQVGVPRFARRLLASVCCAVLLFVLAAPDAHAKIYRCKTASGKILTSDRPIPECLNREQAIIGSSGMVRKRVQPQKTEYELRMERQREKALAEQRAQEAEKRQAEQVLVMRYPDKASHDAKREQALAPTIQTVVMAEQNLKLLLEQRSKLDKELEFYPDQTKMPRSLRTKNTDNKEAIAAQNKLIKAKKTDMARINYKYNMELKRLRELWKEQEQAELEQAEKTKAAASATP